MYQSRLASTLGHTVTLKDDGDAEVASSAYDAVVIAESSSSATVGTKYATTPKGAVVLEQGLWSNATWGFQTTATTNTGLTAVYVNAVTDLDGGYSGNLTVFSSLSSWAREDASNLGSGAQIVAQLTSGDTRTGYYAYESGATLQNAAAAAGRRVATSLLDASVANLTADGWALLFDAPVTWAIGATGGTGKGACHYYSSAGL